MIKQKNTFNSRYPFFIFTLLIWAGSSVPGKSIPHFFEFTPDKLVHFAEYFILGIFLQRWLNFDYADWRRSKKLLIGICIGALVGTIDEFWQSFIPGRSPDYRDWLMDVTGVLIAGWIFYFRNSKK